MNKKEIKLSNGMEMPRLGMGTWFLGENRSKDAEETAALRAGIDAGIRLIDTAEMYGDGRSEQLIGRAIQGYDRSRLFLVSKKKNFQKSAADTEKSTDRLSGFVSFTLERRDST